MYSGALWGTLEDRSRQGPSRDTWLENKINGRRSNFCCSPLYGIQGGKFVYILVGVTRERLNRQTAAGLPFQQLINNSAALSFSPSISRIVPDMNSYLEQIQQSWANFKCNIIYFPRIYFRGFEIQLSEYFEIFFLTYSSVWTIISSINLCVENKLQLWKF